MEHLIHADVYRTESLDEVVELALAELVEERAVALVEWGDVAAPALGEDVLEVSPGPARHAVPRPTRRGPSSSRAKVAGPRRADEVAAGARPRRG